jgi:hypothetical protein
MIGSATGLSAFLAFLWMLSFSGFLAAQEANPTVTPQQQVEQQPSPNFQSG